MARLLLVLLVFIKGDGEVRVFPVCEVQKCYTDTYFPAIYDSIRIREGNYSYHPLDKGGETYGGITRKWNKDWMGWYYIDQVKGKKRNQSVAQAEYWVKQYYLDLWVREGFYLIRDPKLAYALFDFRLNTSPRGVEKKVNKVLNELGLTPVKVQGHWITEEFNTVDPVRFELLLRLQRLKLYNSLVINDPSQAVFYQGWQKRLGI